MARLSKALRFEVLARDGFKCRYCGRGAAITPLHVDHIKPRAKGGSDSKSNLGAACADCNYGKADRSLIPTRTGFDLTPDQRPARMVQMRSARGNPKPRAKPQRKPWADEKPEPPKPHYLDTGEIDELDELNGNYQLCLIWCSTHGKYEWHSIDRDYINSGSIITLSSNEVMR